MNDEPIDLASRRAARATRKVRAGRIPSDFMPFDYGADPAEHQPIDEGGGIPWASLVFLAALVISLLASALYGVRCFFFHP